MPEEQQGTQSGEQPKTEHGKAEAGKTPDSGAGGKDAILADLARERDKRQELETKLTQFEQSQKDQMAALAKAFGLDPEKGGEAGADALAQQVTTLQQQFAATQREATVLKLAAAPGEDANGNKLPAIPPEYHHLLTATDADGLAAQAKSVAALVAQSAAKDQTPGFAASAGQGQNGGGSQPLPAQIAAAETELRGKTPGTPEYKTAQQRLMGLKSQQLAAAASSTK